MKVKRIEHDPTDKRVTHEPGVRFSPQGGCTIPSCGCSPERYLMVTDGKTVLSVTLTPEDVAQLLSGDLVELA